MADASRNDAQKKTLGITLVVILILGALIYGGSYIARGNDPSQAVNDVHGWFKNIPDKIVKSFGSDAENIAASYGSNKGIRSSLFNALVIFIILFILLNLNEKTKGMLSMKEERGKAIVMYVILVAVSIMLSTLLKGDSFYKAEAVSWLFSWQAGVNLAIVAAALYLIANYTILQERKGDDNARYAIILLTSA